MTREEVLEVLMKVPRMTEELADRIYNSGYTDKQKLYDATVEDLKSVEGVDEEMATDIQSLVRKGVLPDQHEELEGPTEERKQEGVGRKTGAEKILDQTMGLINKGIEQVKLLTKKVLAVVRPSEKEAPSEGETTEPGSESGVKIEEVPEEEGGVKQEVVEESGEVKEESEKPDTGDSEEEIVRSFMEAFGIEEDAARSLLRAGYRDLESARAADIIDLAEIDGLTLADAKRIKGIV